MIWMAEALPAGDMHPPNQVLQLEWFYMSFHKEDRAKYIKSDQRLSNETLKSVAEYFENIFNLQVTDGSLAKKRKCQIEQRVRHKMCHELYKRYDKKVRLVTEQCHGGDGCHSRRGSKYHCHDYKWQDHNDSGCRDNYDKRNKKQENTTPSDRDDKAFKPCSVHGPKSKHTFKECYKNPKNDKRQLQAKKCHYEAHHNNACYMGNNDKSRLSTNTPVPSEDPASASSESKKTHEDENYHLYVDKKMKAGSHVPHKSYHQQQRTKSQLSQEHKKGETPCTFLDNDLNFMDTVLIGLDSMDADLDRPDDVTNPFDFNL
jgi:hypothetical protein